MAFIVFKASGNEIIINSEEIVAVTIDPASKKLLIQTKTHCFTVNESMDEVKKTLRAIDPRIKGMSAQELVDRL